MHSQNEIRSGRYTLRDNLLKRQSGYVDTTDDPTENRSGLVDFSIVLGVIMLLTVIIGIVALIFRRKLYCKQKPTLSLEENNQINHISHFGSPNDEEYNSLDYYSNDYLKNEKNNDDKSNDKNSNKYDKKNDTDSESNNNIYNVIGAPGSGLTREVLLKNHRGCTIIMDSHRSDISIDTISTNNNSDAYKSGTPSSTLVDSRSNTMRTNKSNSNIKSIKSNSSTRSNSSDKRSHQISLPTFLPSASIYSQDRAYSIANNLVRSTTFQVSRSPPPIPITSSDFSTPSVPIISSDYPAPPVPSFSPVPIPPVSSLSQKSHKQLKDTARGPKTLPNTFDDENSLSIKSVDSLILHKSPWEDNSTSSPKSNNENNVDRNPESKNLISSSSDYLISPPKIYDKKSSFISFERFSLFKDISKSNTSKTSDLATASKENEVGSLNKKKTSSVNKKKISSINNKGKVSSISNKEKVSSINNKGKVVSINNKEKVSSIHNKEKGSPINNKENFSSNNNKEEILNDFNDEKAL